MLPELCQAGDCPGLHCAPRSARSAIRLVEGLASRRCGLRGPYRSLCNVGACGHPSARVTWLAGPPILATYTTSWPFADTQMDGLMGSFVEILQDRHSQLHQAAFDRHAHPQFERTAAQPIHRPDTVEKPVLPQFASDPVGGRLV